MRLACICEGAAENAIMDILLDSNLLKFSRDDLVDKSIIRCRTAKKFEEKYLRKVSTDKVTVLRILDSRREEFAISKAYRHRVDVINVITAPEIEMLIIHAENRYKKFKQSKKKPSTYCIEDLRLRNVKSYDFVHDYFSDTDKLLCAIKEYNRTADIQRGEYTLFDLIK